MFPSKSQPAAMGLPNDNKTLRQARPPPTEPSYKKDLNIDKLCMQTNRPLKLVHFVVPIQTAWRFPRAQLLSNFIFCTCICTHKLWKDKRSILLGIPRDLYWKKTTSYKLKTSIHFTTDKNFILCTFCIFVIYFTFRSFVILMSFLSFIWGKERSEASIV